MWHCVSVGLVVSGLVVCVLTIVQSTESLKSVRWTVIGILLAGPISGWLYSALRRRQERDAAVAIDQTYRLKDRVFTALDFLNRTADPTIWQELQLEDARQHLAEVDPRTVVPLRAPRSWYWGLVISAAAVSIGFFGTSTNPVVAEILSSDVVVAQVERIEESLKELREFDAEDISPELDTLLQELAGRLKELRQPGVDSHEALALLSQMETSLWNQQRQIKSLNTEAQLMAIGEALSLSDDMQVAGKAMIQGDLTRAAEVLSTMEMPDMDRPTRKAITRELNGLRQDAKLEASRKLQDAAAQTVQGLSQSNSDRFCEGMEGLASECRKQGLRKKLSHLLHKQYRIVGESKTASASDLAASASSNSRGGETPGLGKSGNQPGVETSRLKTDNQMKITGQQSAEGDVDVETITTPEAAQEAVRRYQQQSAEYDRLTESVLESESIPPGHRRTIRRYFELIRPQSDDSLVE